MRHHAAIGLSLAGLLAAGLTFGVDAAPPRRGPQRGAVGTFTQVACTVTRLPSPSEVRTAIDGLYRTFISNGIPDHPVGPFPNAGNPHTIAAQRYSFRIPLTPSGPGKDLRMQPFGVAVNGVVFDPGAAEWWGDDPRSGWQYEALSGAVGLGVDCNNAHVQPGGAYHYHGMPEGLLKAGAAQMTLVGYAADGYPIYGRYDHDDPRSATSPVRPMTSSYRLKAGARPSGPGGSYDGMFVEDYEYVAGLGDLDRCNGRTGETPDFGDTYHYVVTDTFPFIPRCYQASPDPSFETHRGGPGGPGGPGGRGGPPPGGRPPPR